MKTHALVPALTLAAALLVPPLTAGAQGHRSDRGGRPPAHGYYGRQPSRHQGHGYSGRGYGSHGYRYARPYYGSRRYYAPPPPYYGYGYGYGGYGYGGYRLWVLPAAAPAAVRPAAGGRRHLVRVLARVDPRRGPGQIRCAARSSRACGGW